MLNTLVKYPRKFNSIFLTNKYMCNYLLVILISIIVYGLLYCITINHKNFKKRNLNDEYYIKTYINLIISIIIFMIVLKFHTFRTYWIPKIANILIYFIITDTIYYWVHRLIHRTPFLKKTIHSTHHEAIKLLPLDIFYTDYKDNIIYALLLSCLPLLFINISIIEYIIVSVIFFIHSIYTHFETKNSFWIPLFIDSKHHKYHHQIGGGNYSVFLSIWDDYMKTKIKPKVSKK